MYSIAGRYVCQVGGKGRKHHEIGGCLVPKGKSVVTVERMRKSDALKSAYPV